MSENTGPAEPRSPDADETSDDDEFGADIPEDAFYSPEDPITGAEGDIPEDAIYSPDDPITRAEPMEGVVTTMSGLNVSRISGEGDLRWEIRHAANIIEALARNLKEHGMEALRIHPETEPVDAMLRSYIAGYLVGRTDEIE